VYDMSREALMPKISLICAAFAMQYQRVTDTQTHIQTVTDTDP